MDFARVLVMVDAFFKRLEVRYAVIGAFALHAYGLTRATRDLDFAAEASVQGAVLQFLEGLGYTTLHASPGYSNHLHDDPSLGRVDFVYVADDTARQLFGPGMSELALGPARVPVPRPEHLAAMKVQAMKNDPSRTLQELADIRFLLGVPGIDETEIRGYFERHGLLERFDDLKRLG